MFEDASTFSIIVLVILFSIIVVVLTGLGILTNAIFNLDTCDSGVPLPLVNQTRDDKINFINSFPEGTFVNKQQLILSLSNETIPTKITVAGKKIKINDAEVSLSKISLITFWILIIIGLLYYIGFGLVKD